ncbi:MAG: Phosphoglucomutase/phosphomannomutase alpha/beta/alpha domain I [Candidatus Magasanikbacteria bacterium GW2011_GWC2_37_14]|uniref:Phosphoglucomutase/phosphomannomutase alpha/beta/alpha domain I n=1 Tax=Candidatus Magasanikbacteria bacterium GW2011_GWC2_37_14 TaxID=1619046 RepID=A0A0G0GNY8_9BACT|nr:MAG: Phosphoglucomutase/phosphomannomutase alpha/beta/alpha domain I [Candidatus Magasanikbacteria bacterium GW2011_GWC2_37_14]
MQINPHIFRGYDLRGLAGEDLNPLIAEHLGKAFGTFLLRRDIHDVVVGHDCRSTSSEYSVALIKGLLSTGVDVVDIGMSLVGTLYWSQYYFKHKGGVFVTASHNPAQYNGFKFAHDFSSTLVYEELQELRKLAEIEDYIIAGQPGKLKESGINDLYIKDLAGRFGKYKNFKVLIDSGNNNSALIAPELFRQVGCEVFEKNTNIDSSFPLGTPDPTDKIVMQRLADEVMSAGAGIGFTYDADGDRLGVVGNQGEFVWNDVLVALFAADVLHDNPGAKIVFNTLCSKIVVDTIKNNGGIPVMCRTGHSFIKAKAKEVQAKFAGELSGHFFFLDKFYPHDDGPYATLRVLDYLSKTNQTLSQAIASLPFYISSPEIKVFCADDKKVELMSRISPILKKDFPEAEVIDDERAADGVRLELFDGMFVVRYSQNGPYLTVKFEAKTQEKYQELKQYIDKLLHQFGDIDWQSKMNVNIESLD